VRNLRHRCDVMEPPNAQGGYGEGIGQDGVYLRGIPCSLEHLSGREGEVARATFAAATHKVTLYGDPRKPIRKSHSLRVGERILHIADIKDVMQNGEQLELICGEQDG
jgi:head-tail adaptor